MEFSFIDLLNNKIFLLVALLIVGLILFWPVFFRKPECNKISNQYKKDEIPTVNGIADLNNEDMLSTPFGEFRTQMAYNCCATGDFSNDFVGMCAMSNAIKLGVRCLDFEIYSYNGRPVVATSSSNNTSYKESRNELDFADVYEKAVVDAFLSSSGCPNPEDPLIIHLRIQTKQPETIQSIYNIIASNATERLYGASAAKNAGGKRVIESIKDVPMSELLGKIVVLCESRPVVLKNPDLVGLVDGFTGPNTSSYQVIRSGDAMTSNVSEGGTMILPNWSVNATNPDVETLSAKYLHCQFIGMCFQKNDAALKHYRSEYFRTNGENGKVYAFLRIDSNGTKLDM